MRRPPHRLRPAPPAPGRDPAALLGLLLGVCLLCGCQTYTRQSQAMTAAWSAGDTATAAREFGRRADRKPDSKDAVVWRLEAGAAFRAAGDYAESNRHLDAAAARMDAYEQQARVRVASETAALFTNPQNLPYPGRGYERIMLHTYKALNYLALGETERARPELIRAYQAQQDAVRQNQRRIEEAREAERAATQPEALQRSRADPALNAALAGITAPLEGFKFYADYVNPFTVYLDGLYFLHAGSGGADLERAVTSLRRVAAVAGQSPWIQEDLRLAETGARGGASPTPRLTYVLFETGRAASREQVRIDIPIIFADVSYVGAAFPQLVFHPGHAASATITTPAGPATTALVANMDAVVALDFRDEFPVILTKTLVSTIAKAAAGWAVNTAARQQDDGLGLLARLVTAAVQAAVNIADTRCWSTLPKEFQVARLNTPADGRVTITVAGSSPQSVSLVDGHVVVVYVKSITAGRPPWIHQFRLR
ncbi:MAG: hypothetical protein M5U12_31515 [Verrucomicrobia bacterium]|nr:hypothetical protein [Verrucomicrobiota bacterium]